jgi:hypothetical protein
LKPSEFCFGHASSNAPDELTQKSGLMRWSWVKAHREILLNELVDTLDSWQPWTTSVSETDGLQYVMKDDEVNQHEDRGDPSAHSQNYGGRQMAATTGAQAMEKKVMQGGSVQPG